MPNPKLKLVTKLWVEEFCWWMFESQPSKTFKHFAVFCVPGMPFVLSQDMCSKVSHMWLDFFTSYPTSWDSSCRFGSLIAKHL